MKYKTYDELINTVKSNSNELELIRINEELELFANRKWEKYILFSSNLINEIECTSGVVTDLSACFSYLINKSSCLNKTNDDLLNNSSIKETLFNDVLELMVDARDPWGNYKATALSANNAIESCIKESGLFYWEHRDKGNEREIEHVFISNEPIPEDDIKLLTLIIDDKKAITKEEKTVLFKYLHLTFMIRIK